MANTYVAVNKLRSTMSAEGMERRRPFKREILVGDFKPTEYVDYCLPGADDRDEH